ncbi:hypothetical protein ABNX41_19930 [Rhodobacteraceae bacterium PA1-206B]
MDGFRALPSVDQFLNGAEGAALVARHGRQPVRDALRARLDRMRASRCARPCARGSTGCARRSGRAGTRRCWRRDWPVWLAPISRRRSGRGCARC